MSREAYGLRLWFELDDTFAVYAKGGVIRSALYVDNGSALGVDDFGAELCYEEQLHGWQDDGATEPQQPLAHQSLTPEIVLESDAADEAAASHPALKPPIAPR